MSLSSRAVARWKKILLCIAGGILLVMLLIGSQLVCLSAWIQYGVLVPECPDGEMRLGVTLNASALRRGQYGTVEIGAIAHYTTGRADASRSAPVGRLEPSLFLLDGEREVPLEPEKGWKDGYRERRTGRVKLPADLPDGEYKLRAEVDTPLGKGQLEVPLAVFAPAVVHVITDRPLYEPGNTIQFRAVVLRARDLSPLDGRPGKWVVTDPEGAVVLEERSPAGDFGVVAGNFPLDGGATTGTWRVRWESGGAKDEVTVRVEPFTLPRFTVEASAVRPFYQAHDKPRVRGRVTYSSGAPVAGAALEIRWSSAGAWPPPPAWMQGGLPTRSTTDDAGDFELELPAVPADLRGEATLNARIAAVDPAGDRVEGSASVKLSEDAIDVEAVTELSGGLVEGFNNRVFLRVTTAAGTVLPETKLTVKRSWDAADEGVEAKTDADGVAVLQLDPGPAVNVVIPPMPVRPPPRPPVIQRTGARDLLTGAAPRLADQVALDRMNAALEPCGRYVTGNAASTSISVWVGSSGAVKDAAGGDSPLDGCLAGILKRQRFSAAGDRILSLGFSVTTDLPGLDYEVKSTQETPARLHQALGDAVLEARTCLPEDTPGAGFPRLMLYRIANHRLETRFAPDPRSPGTVVSGKTAACVESKLSDLSIRKAEEDEPASTVFGAVRFSARPAPRYQAAKPQATTMLGYELTVAAKAGDGEAIGETEIRFSPGAVPNLRLRPSKVLAKAGDDVELTFIRGPSFSGKLPKELVLRHERKVLKAKVDEKTRTARYTLPEDLDGWFEASWGGARALIYVRPRAELALSVKPDRPRYRPGDTARLAVATRAGDQPTEAAVGLFGVDQSLSQLVPLPGPDDMARIRPKVTMNGKAFGLLDAEALALGRIRGKNAAAATILKVASIPAPADYDSFVGTSGRTIFDPVEALTDHFYLVLAELHRRARAWEESAPKGEVMRPPKMAALWTEAIAACEKRGDPTTDAFGRTLRLHLLPEDLLALTAPRAVIVEGTRLPEDVENWSAWVRRNKP